MKEEELKINQPEEEIPLPEKPPKALNLEAELSDRSQEILDDIKEKSEIPDAASMLEKANEGIELEPSDVEVIDKNTDFSKEYSANVEETQQLNIEATKAIEPAVAGQGEDDEYDWLDKAFDEIRAETEAQEAESAGKFKRKKEKSPLSELDLTKVEAHQVEKRMGKSGEMGNPGEEMKRVKFFQENPELRDAIVSDPFSKESQAAYLKGIVPTETYMEISHGDEYSWLKAAVLAEPKGAYEESFKQLPRSEQVEKLYDQIDVSAEMTMRIQKYMDENLDEINNLPDEELYKTLSQIAFGTEKEDEIEANYALSQRRGFRLSIAHFLEERNKLSGYKTESQKDPKAFAEKYLKENFSGDISIEELPMGFVIYLDENDYALVQSDDRSPKSIPSRGVTLSYRSLPEALQGKVILINRGGKEGGVKSEQDLADTRKHEIRHIVFSDFHAQQSEITSVDTMVELMSCKTEQDYRNLSEVVYGDFVEKAKDEIIAYFSQGQLDESYEALRFDQYQRHIIEEVGKALEKRDDLSEQEKQEILGTFTKGKEKCFQTIRRMRFVAEKLDEQSGEGQLDRDKAEALLRNTPGTKIDRLAKYTGPNLVSTL